MVLSDIRFFELSKGDRVEVFINGRSRMVSPSVFGDCRFYVVYDYNDYFDDDKLPF